MKPTDFARSYDAGFNNALMKVQAVIRQFRSKPHTDCADLLNDLADAVDDLVKVIRPA